MAFPYTVQGKVESLIDSDKSGFTEKLILSTLQNQLHNLEATDIINEDDKLSFITRHSLFKFKYPVSITVDRKDSFQAVYEIKISNLLMIILVLLIFAAFFSKFSFNSYLIFSAIFIVLFYGMNVLFISSFVRKFIKKMPLFNDLDIKKAEKLSDDQIEWQTDPNKCPACGAFISNYSFNCPDCGLRLTKKKHIKKENISGYEDKLIKYHYNPDKKDEKNNS